MTLGSKKRPQVVIVGAGFSGLQAAQSLRDAPVDLTVIDRRNHHLFQPLLYQVATAVLSGVDIAVPIRHVLRKQRNARVLMAEVTGVDAHAKLVRLGEGGAIAFDQLILATGSSHSYFGNDSWEKFAPGLKTVLDATTIRAKVLTAFEKAELEPDLARQRDLMTIVLVGGGPTGVEMAGSLALLSRRALRTEYRNIDPDLSRIILIEAGPRLLATFPESLSLRAAEELEESGIEVRLNARVGRIDSFGVHVGSEVIPAATILWTAGVMASPAGKWLGTETDRAGRVVVLEDLSVPGHPDIFVIGDTAHVTGKDGNPVPGLAPAAMQQGRYVAGLIRWRVKKGALSPYPRFEYRDKGNLATLGKIKAVADFGRIRLSGFLGWLLWAAVHIFYLISFKNRFVVMTKWMFLFFSHQARDSLIISKEGSPKGEDEPIRRLPAPGVGPARRTGARAARSP